MYTYIYIYIYIYVYIYIYSIYIVECLGDLVSISGQAIPKTQKMVLDAALLNTQHYKGKVEQSRVKWSNPGNGVVPFPTPRCSSY